MSDEKTTFGVSDEVWRAAGVDPAAKPTAIAVWQDSLLADRIAKYFSGEKACVVSEICEEFDGHEHCYRCGYLESYHLLRDAQRALTKLTVFRLDEEPVKAHEDLTVTIAAPHNHD
jgi:hypothetical protein